MARQNTEGNFKEHTDTTFKFKTPRAKHGVNDHQVRKLYYPSILLTKMDSSASSIKNSDKHYNSNKSTFSLIGSRTESDYIAEWKRSLPNSPELLDVIGKENSWVDIGHITSKLQNMRQSAVNRLQRLIDE